MQAICKRPVPGYSYPEPVSGSGRPALEMAYRLGPSGGSAGSRVLTIFPVAKSMTWMGPR